LTPGSAAATIYIDFDMKRHRGAGSRGLRGTLELLILKALAAEPLHGVGVFQRIQQITGATVEVSYGSLFPALHRLDERGWLSAEWRASDHNRRAKYYRLTPTGRRQLQREEQEWRRIVAAVSAALEA
jgi:transcriptional regulator